MRRQLNKYKGSQPEEMLIGILQLGSLVNVLL